MQTKEHGQHPARAEPTDVDGERDPSVTPVEHWIAGAASTGVTWIAGALASLAGARMVPAWIAGAMVLLARPDTARGCTCELPEPRVLLPSATKYASAAGPWLVVYGDQASVRLTDDLGQEHSVSSARRESALSACPTTFELVRPVVPLADGERYTLAITAEGASDPSDKRAFVAIDDVPRRVKRTLGVRLERSSASAVLSEAACDAPALVGESAKGWFAAKVSADAPTLLFLQLGVDDAKHGKLVEGNASLDRGKATLYALTTGVEARVPELLTTDACAQVVIRDALDEVVFDQKLCPGAGSFLETTLDVEVPEHLIREAPETEPDGGCGCRSAGQRGGGLGGVLLGATLVVALARRVKAAGR